MPESSPEAETLDTAETAQVEGQQDAKDLSSESSVEEASGQQKGDMLSAVEAALKPKGESPDPANPGSEDAKPEGEKPEGEDDSEDFSDEEKARLSQKAKRRFHKLADQVTSLTSRVSELEQPAQQFQHLVRFASDAGLSVEDMNRGFDTMRNLKQNPQKAYKQLRPIMDQLEEVLGVVLPADLQNAVNLGQITEAHARELSRTRATSTLHQQRADQIERKTQSERQRSDVKGRWDSAANATTEWENSKAKSDPDWKHKQPRVIELIELNLLKKQRENPDFVPTTQDAVAMADEALKKVNEELKRFAPKPKAVNAVTEVGSAPGSMPKPKTMLEAAEQGLARMKAG